MKKKTITIVLSGILLPLLFSFSIYFIGEITKEQKQKLIKSWFDSPYAYMFSNNLSGTSGNALDNLMNDTGEFTAGISGLMFYGGISSSVCEVFDYQADYGFASYKPIEKLSGIKCFLKTPGKDGVEFSYLNPEIIDWGYNNMLPDPNLKVQEYTCKKIYQTVFSRFFRMMTEAYVFANMDNDIMTLREGYVNEMYRDDYQGLNSQEEMYDGALSDYKIDKDGTQMTPAMAIGFWVRRDIDGTSLKLWNTMKKFMKRYDKKWFKNYMSNYKN